jgi:hypothetical protein
MTGRRPLFPSWIADIGGQMRKAADVLALTLEQGIEGSNPSSPANPQTRLGLSPLLAKSAARL